MNLTFAPKFFITLLVILLACSMETSAIRFELVTREEKVAIFYDRECVLDSFAANLLASDIERLSGYRPFTSADVTRASGNVIIIGTVKFSIIRELRTKISAAELDGKWNAGTGNRTCKQNYTPRLYGIC